MKDADAILEQNKKLHRRLQELEGKLARNVTYNIGHSAGIKHELKNSQIRQEIKHKALERKFAEYKHLKRTEIAKLKQERDALLDASIGVRDDLNIRAGDGVVPLGNGAWIKLNQAIQLCEESK